MSKSPLSPTTSRSTPFLSASLTDRHRDPDGCRLGLVALFGGGPEIATVTSEIGCLAWKWRATTRRWNTWLMELVVTSPKRRRTVPT